MLPVLETEDKWCRPPVNVTAHGLVLQRRWVAGSRSSSLGSSIPYMTPNSTSGRGFSSNWPPATVSPDQLSITPKFCPITAAAQASDALSNERLAAKFDSASEGELQQRGCGAGLEQ